MKQKACTTDPLESRLLTSYFADGQDAQQSRRAEPCPHTPDPHEESLCHECVVS